MPGPVKMPPETAHTLLQGDRLSRDFTAVGVEDTVAQALEKLRAHPGTGEIFYCYACDPAGRLVGVVPIRKLIRAAPDEQIASLMFTRVVKLPVDASDALVEDFFVTYRFLAFPVVDAEGRIVGVVEMNQFVDAFSDTLFDEVEGRVRDEVYRFVGLPQDEARETRPGRMALKRFPWLLVNIAGGFLAATTTRLFERTVAELVVVSAFIPMVLVLSESLGVQTTAVSVSMVTQGDVDKKRVAREVLAASLAGLMAAAVVALLGRIYSPGFGFPLALFVAVTVSATLASSLGGVLPFLFKRLKVDPHLASAPLVLAVSDNVTLLAYFGLVTWLLL
ncbi:MULTISPECIES: magnesium transporter [unclassified Corallococcus]|uniref:magnesium transporter n=1 Tax=unclassified Corallococcus TaxID=2685029 RepID=UPI001A8E187F|nr:magnesium transporter [Corallococcus sp. NCRR]MBN9685829.1 magnesium transporter [Corallococcus sp. NCSPR001]WAS82730.1 magnesium transporter [Corallococcus sp. NCRR]